MLRLRNALLVAIALHGTALLLSSRFRARGLTPASARFDSQTIDIESAATPDPTARVPPSGEPASTPLEASAAAASAIGGARSRISAAKPGDVTSAPAAEPSLERGGETGPIAAGSGVPSQPAPERKIDFGLDGFFLRPQPDVLPRVHRPELQRQLDAALAADDVKRGLARGNVLVGSLNSAAREAGPLRGEALVRVTIGADGSLVGVELARGAVSDWARVLSSFRELALRKRVRVPPGARGLLVTFSVKAKLQRPSGKEVEDSAIGVADPSLKPNGLTFHGDFDVADAAGGSQRLVYAHVVSEDVL